MSKFLTPPVWYDKNGEENQSLVNYANTGVGGPTNIAFGLDAKSGTDNDSHSCIAIGYQATATGRSAIAIGSYDSDGNPAIGPNTGVSALGSGTIVIGGGAIASDGSIAIGDQANANISDSIAIGSNATAGSHQIQLGANNNLFNLTVGNGMGAINGVGLSVNSGVIQLGNNNTAYALNVGNGTGTIGIGGVSCNNLTVKVLMKTPLVGFDLSNNFDSGYVNIGNNSDGAPWSYSFSLVTDTNQLYKNRIDSIPYLLVRVTLKPDLGFPRSLMCPTLIPDRDSWVCMSQWNVIEMDGSLNSILSMRLSSSLDNVGNPKITIALRSPSGHAINQEYKKVALEVVRVLNTNFTTP